MKRIEKLLGILLHALIVILLVINLFCIVSVVNAGNNKYSTAGIWGFSFVEAKGQGYPLWIKEGDLIVLRSAGYNNFKEGDVITYSMGDDKFVTQKIAKVQEGSYLIDGNEGLEPQSVTADMTVGRYVFGIPHAGYAMGFARSRTGFSILIAIPGIIVITYTATALADMIHNSSKHRKRVIRRRKRRNIRYLKEELFNDKRAVV